MFARPPSEFRDLVMLAPVASRLRIETSTAAAAAVVLVALGAAVYELPHSLRMTQKQVDKNAGLSSVDRELAPARAYGVHQDLAVRAAAVIPRDGVFVVTTTGQPAGVAAAPFYAYWLLPRRHTDDVASAQWIVDWGTPPASLGVKTSVAADLGGGAQVLRVER